MYHNNAKLSPQENFFTQFKTYIILLNWVMHVPAIGTSHQDKSEVIIIIVDIEAHASSGSKDPRAQ